ncbi:hypothetical protein ES703_77449 [subsurface metagenome]
MDMKYEKKIFINIDDICDAMEDHSFDINYYLNLETGEVIIKITSDVDLFDSEAEEDIEYDLSCLQSIPSIDSSEAYRNMEDFVENVKDLKVKRKLINALNDHKPFRRFDSLDIKYRIIERKKKSVIEQIAGKEKQQEEAINTFIELTKVIDSIIEIVLFGSLIKEKRVVNDIDLMVFIENTNDISKIAKARRKVSGSCYIGLDVFILTKKGQYLGNICHRKNCPTMSVDCQVYGCGDIKYIRRYPDYNFDLKIISNDKIKLLYHNPGYEESLIKGLLK